MILSDQRRFFASIDGQPVNVAGPADLITAIVARAKGRETFTLFTLNLDHLVKRRLDPAFAQAYARATLVSADGAPIIALARRQGAELERATGADLVTPLCLAAAREGLPIYLFGSTAASLASARAALLAHAPGLDIRGLEAPPHGFDPASAAADAAGARIAASGARLCFVALGAPKQEIFADRMAARGEGVGYLCIGAALDFLSGEQRRAPTLLRRLGLEWTWRLVTNPRRLGLRYARCAALLAELVLLAPPIRRTGV